MFDIFSLFSRKIDPSKIKTLEDALKAIKIMISRKDWGNAKIWIGKLKAKEKEIWDKNWNLYQWNEDKLSQVWKVYNDRISKIHNIELILEETESKYKIQPDKVKEFNWALDVIKRLISVREYEKWRTALREIKLKEKEWIDYLIDKLNREWDTIYSEKEKTKQYKLYNKKVLVLDKLEYEIDNSERKYKEEIENARFKVRFKKIESELEFLGHTWKNHQALNILKDFLDQNKENSLVIKFYNKQKGIILKNIEKEKAKEEAKIKKDLRLEAMKLTWENIWIDVDEEMKQWLHKQKTFLWFFKDKIKYYKRLKNNIEEKKLLDEVTILIEENDLVKRKVAEEKLQSIHNWLVKEIRDQWILWYDIYWKILWANKISWDSFWMEETKKKYDLFLWDATGHWIKAWLIVTLLTRLFNKYAKTKNIEELAFEINNWLKQDLQSRNFITWILFEIEKDNLWKFSYVWMGHEPMLLFRAKTETVERVMVWGLAAWIRLINKVDQVKTKSIFLENWDVVLSYSDWVVECKWMEWDYYSINRLEENFKNACILEKDSKDIYKRLIDTVASFRWWTKFDDDATIIIMRRDWNKDLLKKDSEIIKNLEKKEWLTSMEVKRLIWKNKEEINLELKKIRREKEKKVIIATLENLYKIWEYIKLKQEAKRYISEWWIDKKINFYMRSAIDNENNYRIKKKNERVDNRYKMLVEILKKWDCDTVIKEAEEIIAKDGNI